MDEFLINLLFEPLPSPPKRSEISEEAKTATYSVRNDQILLYGLIILAVGIGGFMLRCLFSWIRKSSTVTPRDYLGRNSLGPKGIASKVAFPRCPAGDNLRYKHLSPISDGHILGRASKIQMAKNRPPEYRPRAFRQRYNNDIKLSPVSFVTPVVNRASKPPAIDSTDASPPRVQRRSKKRRAVCDNDYSYKMIDPVKLRGKTQRLDKRQSEKARKSSIRIDEFEHVMCLQAKDCGPTNPTVSKTDLSKCFPAKSFSQTSVTKRAKHPHRGKQKEKGERTQSPVASNSHLYINAGNFTVEVKANKHSPECVNSPIKDSNTIEIKGHGDSPTFLASFPKRSEHEQSDGSKFKKKSNKYRYYEDANSFSPKSPKVKRHNSRFGMLTTKYDAPDFKTRKQKGRNSTCAEKIESDGKVSMDSGSDVSKTNKDDESSLTSKHSSVNDPFCLGCKPSEGPTSKPCDKRNHKSGDETHGNCKERKKPNHIIDIHDPTYFSVQKRQDTTEKNKEKVPTHLTKPHSEVNAKQKYCNSALDKISDSADNLEKIATQLEVEKELKKNKTSDEKNLKTCTKSSYQKEKVVTNSKNLKSDRDSNAEKTLEYIEGNLKGSPPLDLSGFTEVSEVTSSLAVSSNFNKNRLKFKDGFDLSNTIELVTYPKGLLDVPANPKNTKDPLDTEKLNTGKKRAIQSLAQGKYALGKSPSKHQDQSQGQIMTKVTEKQTKNKMRYLSRQVDGEKSDTTRLCERNVSISKNAPDMTVQAAYVMEPSNRRFSSLKKSNKRTKSDGTIPFVTSQPQLDKKIECDDETRFDSHDIKENVGQLPSFKLNNEKLLYIDLPIDSDGKAHPSPQHAKRLEPLIFPICGNKYSGCRSPTPQFSVLSLEGKQSNAQNMNDVLVGERMEQLMVINKSKMEKQNHHLSTVDTDSCENSLEVTIPLQADNNGHFKISSKNKNRFIENEGNSKAEMERNQVNEYFPSTELLKELQINTFIRNNKRFENNYQLKDSRENKSFEWQSDLMSCENKKDIPKRTKIPVLCKKHSDNKNMDYISKRQQLRFQEYKTQKQNGSEQSNETSTCTQASIQQSKGREDLKPFERKGKTETTMWCLPLATRQSNPRRLQEEMVQKRMNKIKRRISRYMKNGQGHMSPGFNFEVSNHKMKTKGQNNDLADDVESRKGNIENYDEDYGSDIISNSRFRSSCIAGVNKKSKKRILGEKNKMTLKDAERLKRGENYIRAAPSDNLESISIEHNEFSVDGKNPMTESVEDPTGKHYRGDRPVVKHLSRDMNRYDVTLDHSGGTITSNEITVKNNAKSISSRVERKKVSVVASGKLNKSHEENKVNTSIKKTGTPREGRLKFKKGKKPTEPILSETKPPAQSRLTKMKKLKYKFHKAPIKAKTIPDETNLASVSEQISHLDIWSPSPSVKKNTRPINTSSYQVLKKTSKPSGSDGASPPHSRKFKTRYPRYKLHKSTGNSQQQSPSKSLTENKSFKSGSAEVNGTKESNQAGESFTSTYKTLHKKRNTTTPFSPDVINKQSRKNKVLNMRYKLHKPTEIRQNCDNLKQNSSAEDVKNEKESLERDQTNKKPTDGSLYRTMHTPTSNAKQQADRVKQASFPSHPDDGSCLVIDGINAESSGYTETQPLEKCRGKNNVAESAATLSSTLTKRAIEAPKVQSYLQAFRDSNRLWPPSSKSVEKLSEISMTQSLVRQCDEVIIWSNDDAIPHEEMSNQCVDLDIIHEVDQENHRARALDLSTVDRDDFMRVGERLYFPTPNLNDPCRKQRGLSSILRNLACIEHLDPDEEEKLLLPQHLPDLIMTSSGDSSGGACSNSDYVMESCQLFDSNETCNHALTSPADDSNVDKHLEKDSKHSIRMCLSPTGLDEGNDKDNISLNNQEIKDIRINSREKIDNLASHTNSTNTLDQGKKDIQKPISSTVKITESVSPRLSAGSIHEIRLSDPACSIKTSYNVRKRFTFPECNTRSKPCYDLVVDDDGTNRLKQNNVMSIFSTPNFHDVFKDTNMLEKWTKANIQFKKPSSSNEINPINDTGVAESTKCTDSDLNKEDETQEIIKINSFVVKKEHKNEMCPSIPDYYAKENKKTLLPSEKESCDETKENKLEFIRLPIHEAASYLEPYAQADTLLELKPLTFSKEDKNEDQNQKINHELFKSEKSSAQTSSDIIISWLDDDKKGTASKQIQNNAEDVVSSRSPVDENQTTDAGRIEPLPERAHDMRNIFGNQEQKKVSEPSCQSISLHKTGEENIFLKMARIKRPKITERVNKKEDTISVVENNQQIKAVSPPRVYGFYVKSAMSYTKKKSLFAGTNDTLSIGNSGDETLLQDHTNHPSTGESTSNHKLQQQLTSNSMIDPLPERMTKNNNKTRNTLTSMYTTLIDAVAQDGSSSTACNAYSFEDANPVSHNIFGREENLDNTSDDVLTDELSSDCSSSWSAAGCATRNAMVLGTINLENCVADEMNSNSFQRLSDGQGNRRSSFVLDWYRPSLQAKVEFGTRNETGAEAYNDDDDDDDNDEDGENYSDFSLCDDGGGGDAVAAAAAAADDDDDDYYYYDDDDDDDNDNDDDNDENDDDHEADHYYYESVSDEYTDSDSSRSSLSLHNDTYTCSTSTSEDRSCSDDNCCLASHSSPLCNIVSLSRRNSIENTNSIYTGPSYRSTFTWCNQHKDLNHTLSNNNRRADSDEVESSNILYGQHNLCQCNYGGLICKYPPSENKRNIDVNESSSQRTDTSAISNTSGSSLDELSTVCHPPQSPGGGAQNEETIPHLNLTKCFEKQTSETLVKTNFVAMNYSNSECPETKGYCGKGNGENQGLSLSNERIKTGRLRELNNASSVYSKTSSDSCSVTGENNKFCTCPLRETIFSDGCEENSSSSSKRTVKTFRFRDKMKCSISPRSFGCFPHTKSKAGKRTVTHRKISNDVFSKGDNEDLEINYLSLLQ